MVRADRVEHHIGKIFLKFVSRAAVSVPFDAVHQVLRVRAVLFSVRLGGGKVASVFAHKKELLAAKVGFFEGFFVAGDGLARR